MANINQAIKKNIEHKILPLYLMYAHTYLLYAREKKKVNLDVHQQMAIMHVEAETEHKNKNQSNEDDDNNDNEEHWQGKKQIIRFHTCGEAMMKKQGAQQEWRVIVLVHKFIRGE